MMSKISVLDVSLHNRPVGTITHLPGDQTLFSFGEAYIEDENRPTLSLSFKDVYGGLLTGFRPVQTRVPPFFSNLLPEGALRRYLAGRAGIKEAREFPLLGILGGDLPGAVVVRPAEGEEWPAGDDHQHDEDEGRAMRFSLAGVQLKFSAVMGARGGLTIPASGAGGDWIIKLPSATYTGVPENEFSMMELARHAGIDVPEVKLVPVQGVGGLPVGTDEIGGDAFAIRRFDRGADHKRIHMEDFAQIFSVFPERKYQKANYCNLAEVIWTEIGTPGVIEFVRRLVFNALIGNADMHLKNWSLIYPDGRTPALAPAYDFVSTIAYIEDEKMALNLAPASTKRFADLDLEAFRRLANKVGAPAKIVTDAVDETRTRFDEAWKREKSTLPLSKGVIAAVEEHRATLKL
ncbi:type II toxin-antitoxin system HipA family toxin [Maricaulis sp.]|uniref:type II toxin-antitoxin system HipA family toxin n=1 Tax=Maricaulis sp. TaxID=1486257 RepID=UPI003A91E3E2